MGANGFIIRHDQGKSSPAMACETCGAIISDYEDACVVYENEGVSRSSIKVLCKTNGCSSNPAFKDQPWMDMTSYLLLLAYNSGLRTEKQLRDDWEWVGRMETI